MRPEYEAALREVETTLPPHDVLAKRHGLTLAEASSLTHFRRVDPETDAWADELRRKYPGYFR